MLRAGRLDWCPADQRPSPCRLLRSQSQFATQCLAVQRQSIHRFLPRSIDAYQSPNCGAPQMAEPSDSQVQGLGCIICPHFASTKLVAARCGYPIPQSGRITVLGEYNSADSGQESLSRWTGGLDAKSPTLSGPGKPTPGPIASRGLNSIGRITFAK